jgi:hypothetical protein
VLNKPVSLLYGELSAEGGINMNATALFLGAVIALAYYFYTRRREKNNSKCNVVSDVQEHKTSNTQLSERKGEGK